MFVKPVRMDQACWFCNYNTISLKNMETVRLLVFYSYPYKIFY